MGIFQSSRTCCFFFKAGRLIMNTTFKRQLWLIILHFLKLLLHIQSYWILCTTAHGELWPPKRFASILLYLPLGLIEGWDVQYHHHHHHDMSLTLISADFLLLEQLHFSRWQKFLSCTVRTDSFESHKALSFSYKIPHSSFIFSWDTFLFIIHFVLTVFFTSFSCCTCLSGSSYVHKISD